jgi:hypothetical protein
MVHIMTTSPFLRFWLCTACVAMMCGAGALAAEDASPAARPAAALAPFLSDDAFYVGYVDLQLIDPVAIADEVASIVDCPDAKRQELRSVAQVAKSMLDGVRASGIRAVYAVIGLADVSKVGGPLVIVEISEPKNAESVEAALRAALQFFGQPLNVAELKLLIKQHSTGVLLVGTKATIERYEWLKPSARPELAEPLARLAEDGAAVALVFSPGPDFRRVVRELWPAMPDWLPQLKPLTGQFLADRFRYDELAVYAPPQMSIRWAAQMSDPDAAKIGAQVIRDVPAVIDRAADEEDVPDDVRSLVLPLSKLLIPKVDAARVTLRVDADSPNVASLVKLIAIAHDEAINESQRAVRMNDFKQLALVILNYHDANRHFPSSAAIRDANGQPLLSWRVAILPYLDDAEAAALYKQFHLDEPWDSPHNRELIKKMPAVFADPGHPKLTEEGKTTYLVPVGPGTVFDATEPLTVGDISDGTDKTIMLVDVAPDRGVEWTRPADWDVDMERPLDGLKQPGRTDFVVALCDGSVRPISLNIDPTVLRALLTRAGGETVEKSDVP